MGEATAKEVREWLRKANDLNEAVRERLRRYLS